YQTRAVKLMALYDRNQHPHPPTAFHAYKLFFHCELLSLERQIDPNNVETGAVGFFALDDLPELALSLTRVTPGQIARCFAHLHNPDLPTDFD
ncbi:MAG: ADP-ribose pyrophosphatase, partial [Chloroflexi bacterium]|nr:ADP-ribose pyrophosphatase [Chloroflexota bacterium]